MGERKRQAGMGCEILGRKDILNLTAHGKGAHRPNTWCVYQLWGFTVTVLISKELTGDTVVLPPIPDYLPSRITREHGEPSFPLGTGRDDNNIW